PLRYLSLPFVYFLSASAPPQIRTLSLHDALPIFRVPPFCLGCRLGRVVVVRHHQQLRRVLEAREVHFLAVDDQGSIAQRSRDRQDRKSTRLNSSHVKISYAVFYL